MKKPQLCRGLRVIATYCNQPKWRGQDSNLWSSGSPRKIQNVLALDALIDGNRLYLVQGNILGKK